MWRSIEAANVVASPRLGAVTGRRNRRLSRTRVTFEIMALSQDAPRLSTMPRSETRAERIYVRLRADILTGRLLPGQRLPFADLGVRYETSVGVLREALSRLVEQGLVLAEPQLGFRVTPVSAEDLRDLTNTRIDIETLCLRHAIAQGDLAWESRLVAAFHTLAHTPELATTEPPTVNEDWAVAHAGVPRGDPRGLPEPAAARHRRLPARRRRAVPALVASPRRRDTRDIAGEHLALREAVLARDVGAGHGRAVAAHRVHDRGAAGRGARGPDDGAARTAPGARRPGVRLSGRPVPRQG